MHNLGQNTKMSISKFTKICHIVNSFREGQYIFKNLQKCQKNIIGLQFKKISNDFWKQVYFERQRKISKSTWNKIENV